MTPTPRRAKRIQRQRTKGWRMPEGAVYVGRPSRWGNDILPTMRDLHDQPLGVTRAVELYRTALLRMVEDGERDWTNAWFATLRGRDLACWCPLDQPCHADVLPSASSVTSGATQASVPEATG